jgi:hypothetical protein
MVDCDSEGAEEEEGKEGMAAWKPGVVDGRDCVTKVSMGRTDLRI